MDGMDQGTKGPLGKGCFNSRELENEAERTGCLVWLGRCRDHDPQRSQRLQAPHEGDGDEHQLNF